MDKIWIFRDIFILNTFNRYFHLQPEGEFYMKKHFQVSSFMSDKSNSLDTNMLSRYQNLLVGVITEQVILPKVIVIVPDDDLINYVNHPKPGLAKILGKVINWLMREYEKILQVQKDFLPVKAKKDHFLYMIWSEAPYHDNFMDIDNEMRDKFNSCLRAVGKMKENVSVLALKKFGILKTLTCSLKMLTDSLQCRTVKVTDTEPYYIRAVPATKAFIHAVLC